MRRFQVTVNGNIYDRSRRIQGGQAAASVASTWSAPAPALQKLKQQSCSTTVTGGAQGEHKVNSPMPGTI